MPDGAFSDALEQSRVRGVLEASHSLSQELRVIFERTYLRGHTRARVCADIGLTDEQFGSLHDQLVRHFQGAARGPTPVTSAAGA